MNILLTNLSEFVITRRNQENNNFYVRPKSDVITEQTNKTDVISPHEGFKTEKEIIKMIENKISFFTLYDNSFTKVIVVNNNIKSYRNNTMEDNIGKLPIYKN